MDISPPPPSSLKDRLNRVWKSNLRLPLVLAPVVLGIILWLVLRSIPQSPQLSTEWHLLLLLVAALLSLGIGLGGLAILLNRRGRSLEDVLTLPLILVLAYLIPALAFVIPDWITRLLAAPQWMTLKDLLGQGGLTSGQPWFFLWQALVLAGSGLTRKSGLAATAPPANKLPLIWQIATGLLAGLAAWLMAVFVYSLLAAPSTTLSDPPSPILQVVLLIAGVLLAPWAEERLFRGEILPRWETSLGRRRAVLASAALFASLQLRPLLWLPAFVIGLALGELTLQTRRLTHAILAHALCNLLFFLLGWYLLI